MTAIDLIIKHEGLRLKVYDDATGHPPQKTWEGNLTIGYGLNIEAGISKELARHILDFIINEIKREISRRWSPFYLQKYNVKTVLINVAYNCGVDGLMGFERMLKALAAGDYNLARKELLDSDAARELPERYSELAGLLM